MLWGVFLDRQRKGVARRQEEEASSDGGITIPVHSSIVASGWKTNTIFPIPHTFLDLATDAPEHTHSTAVTSATLPKAQP